MTALCILSRLGLALIFVPHLLWAAKLFPGDCQWVLKAKPGMVMVPPDQERRYSLQRSAEILQKIEAAVPARSHIFRDFHMRGSLTIAMAFQYFSLFGANYEGMVDSLIAENPKLDRFLRGTRSIPNRQIASEWARRSKFADMELRYRDDPEKVIRAIKFLQNIFLGNIGELKAIIFFQDRLIDTNVYTRNLPAIYKNNGQLTEGPLSRQIDILKDRFFQLEDVHLSAADSLAFVTEGYPNLFRGSLDLARTLSWKEAIDRLQALEADLLLHGRGLAYSWVEVKSRRGPVTLATLLNPRPESGGRILNGLLKLWDLRRFFEQQSYSEIEVFFPDGVTEDARTYLEGSPYYFTVHDGKTVFY